MAAALTGTGSAPTSNFQADAGQNIDATKMQALQSLAQSGSSGMNALSLAGQQQAASRQAALQSAMAFSAARGGAFNPAVQANTQQQVSAPFDSREAALNMIRGNFQQADANTNNAYGRYFDLTKAGLPVANAALGAANSAAYEKAYVQGLKDKLALQKAQGGGMTDSQITSSLGGAADAGAYINDTANREDKTGTDINGWSARTGGVGSGMVGNPTAVGGELGYRNPQVPLALSAAAAAKAATATAKQKAADAKAAAAASTDANYQKYLGPTVASILGTDANGNTVPKMNEAQALAQLTPIVGAKEAQKIVSQAQAIANNSAG